MWWATPPGLISSVDGARYNLWDVISGRSYRWHLYLSWNISNIANLWPSRCLICRGWIQSSVFGLTKPSRYHSINLNRSTEKKQMWSCDGNCLTTVRSCRYPSKDATTGPGEAHKTFSQTGCCQNTLFGNSPLLAKCPIGWFAAPRWQRKKKGYGGRSSAILCWDVLCPVRGISRNRRCKIVHVSHVKHVVDNDRMGRNTVFPRSFANLSRYWVWEG